MKLAKLPLFLAVGTLLLYGAALFFIIDHKVLGVVLLALAVGVLVAARHHWPADHDLRGRGSHDP